MQNNQDLAVYEKLNQFEMICRQKGFKLTHQQLEIYRELLLSANHPFC